MLAFLEWDKEHRAETTHDRYKRHILASAESIPQGLTVREVKNSHVNRWIEKSYKGTGANYRRKTIVSVQRSFNWAAHDEQLISRNPILGVKKPAYTQSNKIIEPEQWSASVAALEAQDENGQAILDLITFMRHTGCRLKEARAVEAKHLDRKNRCIEFAREKSKESGKDEAQEADPRVIPLTDVCVGNDLATGIEPCLGWFAISDAHAKCPSDANARTARFCPIPTPAQLDVIPSKVKLI